MPYMETNQNEHLARYSLSNWAADAGELPRIQSKAWLEIKTLFQNKADKKKSSSISFVFSEFQNRVKSQSCW